MDLNDTQTRDQETGRLCSFPAVLDVLLFNRMQRLVVQTSAVGFPLPTIKWFSQLEEVNVENSQDDHKKGEIPTLKGWEHVPSQMFDSKNDSVASFATIQVFEGTLNVICVAENEAGSSHRLKLVIYQ